MVLVQLKRNNTKEDSSEDELPTKDEIRESGAIAQDADVVLLIHRNTKKEDETDPKGIFIIDKNRRGQAPRTFKVRCVLEKSAFRDIPKEELSNEETQKAEINLEELENKFTNESNNLDSDFDFLNNINLNEDNNIENNITINNNMFSSDNADNNGLSDDDWTKELFEE